MAFNPGGTDYRGAQASRDRADEGLTRALDAKGRADKQARIKKSGERSPLQKLISAGVRGAAAYYTGGASEKFGFGGAIDSAMLGTDSEGRAVRNEYGDLVGAGTNVYLGSKAEKESRLAGADAAFNKQYAKRQANVDRLFEHADTAEAKDQAFKAQQSLDAYEQDYLSRKKDVAEKGFLGTNIGVKDSEYTALTAGMSPEELSQRRMKMDDERNEQIMKGQKEAEQRQAQAIQNYTDEDRRRKNQTSLHKSPPKQPYNDPIIQQAKDNNASQVNNKMMMQAKIAKAEREERNRLADEQAKKFREEMKIKQGGIN